MDKTWVRGRRKGRVFYAFLIVPVMAWTLVLAAIAITGTLREFGLFAAGMIAVTGLLMGRILLKEKRAQEERAQFLSLVAHELKAPLTLVKESLDVLHKGISGPLNGDQTKIVGLAKRHIDRLARLAHQVLDFEGLHAREASSERGELGIYEVLEEVRMMALPLLANKNLDFDVCADAGLPPLWANKDQVIQVLIDLVDNAAKFTDEGGVAVMAKAIDSAVQISVADTGIGIAEEDLPKLFQPFSQILRKDGRRKEGTGLGLAICKKIVEQHGGQIRVESRFGAGSTFFLTLPARRLHETIAVKKLLDPALGAKAG